MSNQIAGFVKGIVLGSIIGAAMGILFAPQSGRKTRRDINNNTDKLLKKARKEYEATLKKGGKAYESAVKQAKQLESSAKDTVGAMGEKADELADMGKEALHDTKKNLARAVDKAVHAFR